MTSRLLSQAAAHTSSTDQALRHQPAVRRVLSEPTCQQEVRTAARRILRPGEQRHPPAVQRAASAGCGAEHPSLPPALRPFVCSTLLSRRGGKALPLSKCSDQSPRAPVGLRRWSLSPYRLCCLRWLWENQALHRY
ncbi:hypothetical protein FQA47_020359 [Oryzias melastigma]|uniref:Uncharacterized protein n=1 Tax=Oryzias melastigma TaxID=30732 RepID=A0A834C5F5_ORYME|nr:hypothetical protein FQA47_020359 [Oryzias melastigma]